MPKPVGRRAAPRQRARFPVVVVVVALLVGAALGALGAQALEHGPASTDSPGSAEPPVDPAVAAAELSTSSSVDGAGMPVSTTSPTVSTTHPVAASPIEPSDQNWSEVARNLAPLIRLPSDCPLPLNEPESLPNADRSYRGGVHEGIDFICGESGRSAVAAMDGVVVVANQSYVDPSVAERDAVLAIAKDLGYTPPWILAMLFGRFVVIDHGTVDGAGHVVSIYAHFEKIDRAIRPGLKIKAGARLGEIGNRGTETAAARGTRSRSIHLHWELHIDAGFLGEGQSAAQTRATYASLFGKS